MVSVSHKGSFKNLDRFLKTMKKFSADDILNQYGQKGLDQLRTSTPIDSGISAESWDYYIDSSKGQWSITWTNSNLTRDGVPVVILLQFGHGTGTGGFFEGYDFINPSLRPVFDKLADDVWKAVQQA